MARLRQDKRTFRDTLRALPWLAPVLLLFAGIVVYPMGLMVYNSTRTISRIGVDKGSAGFDNFAHVLSDPALPRVLLNTVIWVVSVVVLTILISLALANFLNKVFPGRQLVRLAVIIPWAASVVMTTTVIYYALEPKLGIGQQFLHDIGLTESTDYGFTKQPVPAFTIAILVAVFVSLPFTTYTILAGHAAIGHDVIEAARVDGASRTRIYFSIILPQLKSAIAVATTINIINVFNNLPILQVLTGSIPGNAADTTTTLLFKYIRNRGHLDWASALSVINLIIMVVLIGFYLYFTKPMKGVDD
ncbi:carbohydrate ABC transporter permease [Corynebacterium pygosceleis]|uniref:Sugar ABC transporter permease n=1 Tax=Corynebacterium pygosceleis TaxID=2800406 RepID=A0A9Q4GJ83_9CORY|nr:sugar ABC transporter permease [Corynebacterium pygosceleis]MCK7638452.1 sugar ABC transporter permease [Corynebacterium pygosceleis]MCK7675432.1 sugar ABC transporter permease [Corynebacterium pygosceleis]MCL0121174.1 sugar ABC transporter permease [Corynebacterium pygosceleis]MCX7445388.1 sugar ABC transporter permease [Corynebacterium pygosceleis]MCX7469116.1 sugar ABC transporter permease [Corynebacterium pygosceleis]